MTPPPVDREWVDDPAPVATVTGSHGIIADSVPEFGQAAEYIVRRFLARKGFEREKQRELSGAVRLGAQNRIPLLDNASLLRVIGFTLLGLGIVPVFRLWAQPAEVAQSLWLPAALLLTVYPLVVLAVTRSLINTPDEREPVWLLLSDTAMVTLAIHMLGGPTGGLFWLGLVLVATQVGMSWRRTAIAAALVLSAHLGLTVWGSPAPADAQEVAWRALIIAFGGLYLTAGSAIVDRRRRAGDAAIEIARLTIADLERESVELREARERWRNEALHDPLTGLLNRKGILDRVDRGLRRAVSSGIPFAIAAIDIDGFKLVNDRFGHLAGDDALRGVARAILGTARPFDAVGRLGGDELLIALPNCDGEGAAALAERLGQSVRALGVAARGPASITLSIGVSEVRPDDSGAIDQLLDRADRALYEAKNAGGDCVRSAP